jgi:hypothetical protein
LTSGKDPTWNLSPFNFKLHPVMIGVLGHLILLSVGYVASLFFAAPEKSYRALTLWGWLENRRLKKLNGLNELNKAEDITQLGAQVLRGGGCD